MALILLLSTYAEACAARDLPSIPLINFQPNVFEHPDVTKLKKYNDIFREALHISFDLLSPVEIEKLRWKKTDGRCYYDDSPHFPAVAYSD